MHLVHAGNIRAAATELAIVIVDSTKAGPDQEAVIRALRTCVLIACDAIAQE